MSRIFNFIKSIEQKLSAPEAPELQFVNLEWYDSNFNWKTFAWSIFSKIENTTYLISQLKMTIEKTKNEIVDQINSNFNNYVTLISKLQTIDFLIDNITTSLDNIKNKINSKWNLVVLYRKELEEMLEFIHDNDTQMSQVEKMIEKYENKIKCEKWIDKIDVYLKDNNTGVVEREYSTTWKLMHWWLNFYQIKNNGVYTEDTGNTFGNISTITASSERYMNITNELFFHYLTLYFTDTPSKQNKNIKTRLSLNVIALVHKIYLIQGIEKRIYEIIFDNYTKGEVNKIFDLNIPMSKIITDITKLLNSEKYSNLNIALKTPELNRSLFWVPFLDRFMNDKFLFNCSDFNQFKDNYTSILDFIKLFDTARCTDQIKCFIQTFSFFTYYQYIQNDISMKLVVMINIKDFTCNESLVKLSNSIFNYLKTVKELFIERKIFLKNLPNFLNFLLQCTKFWKIKIKDIEDNSELLKWYHHNDKELGYDMEENERRIIEEYLTNKRNLINYFKVDQETKDPERSNTETCSVFARAWIELMSREMIILENECDRKEWEKEIVNATGCISLILC